jgi:hypothetical protein
MVVELIMVQLREYPIVAAVELQVEAVEVQEFQVIISNKAVLAVVVELLDKVMLAVVVAGGPDQIHLVAVAVASPVLVLAAQALIKTVPALAVMEVQEQLAHSQVVQ